MIGLLPAARTGLAVGDAVEPCAAADRPVAVNGRASRTRTRVASSRLSVACGALATSGPAGRMPPAAGTVGVTRQAITPSQEEP